MKTPRIFDDTFTAQMRRFASEARKANRKNCESCSGAGHHGYEPETGLPYTCHACGGTGFRA